MKEQNSPARAINTDAVRHVCRYFRAEALAGPTAASLTGTIGQSSTSWTLNVTALNVTSCTLVEGNTPSGSKPGARPSPATA